MEQFVTTDVYVGIDIGGSHVSVGVIDTELNILQTDIMAIQTDISPSDCVAAITAQVTHLIAEVNNLVDKQAPRKVCGIGIGCPGQSKDGILVGTATFPKFVNVPLRDMIRDNFDNVDVILLNDADAALAAEIWSKESYKEYEGIRHVAMITLGTGIGVGLLLNGMLYQGHHGLVEAGHMIVDSSSTARSCTCGQVRSC
jgi:glucokinase